MRVATYNLLHGLSIAKRGAADLPAAADAVAALDADMVALQEVDRGLARSGGVDQGEWIADRMGWSWAFAPALLGSPDTAWRACPDGRDPGGEAYGVGLLSREPLRVVTRVRLPGGGDGHRQPRRSPPAGPLSRPLTHASPRNPGWDREPRVALVADIEVGGRRVRLVTTHLSYLPHRGLAQLRAAAAAADRVTVEADRGHGSPPAVLVGDLNLPVWAVRLLLGRWWDHAGGAPTYPAWRPRVQPDQLLVRGLDVVGVDVGSPATSDHLPLIATLALR